jgi:hypothetical protein
MRQDPTLTRRQILAGLGAVGVVAGVPRAARALRGDPPFTAYTVAQTDGPDLRVAWYEYDTTDGSRIEDSARYTPGATLEATNESFAGAAAAGEFVDRTGPDAVDAGPAIRFGNVLPGDGGALVIGLLTDADARIWLRLSAPPDADGRARTLAETYLENGVNEPERVAGDTDPEGDLQDALGVRLWYDNGLTGGCDGRVGLGESFVSRASSLDADGTFGEVAPGLADGVALDFGLLDGACLPAGTQRCLSLRWALPAETGNEVQGDSLAFDLRFRATACDDDRNPFAPAGGSA